ncbi:9026_t:CDS:1 [Paraglomus brasilianum]|uniref:9026_t:CDS:1 n=1 Tax=Paraglomus brasilianum TaxID=144538 RepID=A0A9N9H8L4_9GLOM|nr:9026_t:CDS:1 [Paraglomus brasilianum]
MAGVNNQTNNGSYANDIPSDQMYVVDANGLPLDRVHSNSNSMDANSIPLDQTVGGEFSNNYSYQPLFQASSSQAAFLWNTNDNIHTRGNEQLNTTSYGYVENNENLVNNSSSIYYPPSNSIVQALSTSTLSNNSGMTTNATSHGCIVIVMKADANLERLLSIIQLCGRVERLYDCPSFFIYRISWYW